MIYIFSGVQSICSLPGMCCRACGDCCASINCKPIKDCCDACGKGCTGFMERPLSTFVILSIVLSAIQILLCVQAMGSKCDFGDDATIGQSIWVMVELGFAVVNVLFAFYFQKQVWSHIEAKKAEYEQLPQGGAAKGGLLGGLRGGIQNIAASATGGPTNTAAEDPAPEKSEKIRVPSESVQASFKEVFLKDFGVLAYFFGLLVIFGLSYIGKGNVDNDKANCKMESFVWVLGVVFFWVALIYTLLWYCCKCCAGTVTLERDEDDGA